MSRSDSLGPRGGTTKAMGAVQFIAVHCAATPPGMEVTAEMINEWHRKRGFDQIGYHFVIRWDGMVEKGRSLELAGAHVVGWNHCAIGICLAGGVDGTKEQRPAANFTAAQMKSLKALIADLKAKYPLAKVQGHRDFPGVAKACPSFDVAHWLETGALRA